MAETVAHEVGAPAGSELEADPRPDRGRPRIAYLSWSTGEFDARTERMAATALAHGYDVVVYARLEPGVEPATDTAGYRIVRVAAESGRGIPGGPVVVRLIRRLVGGPRSAAVERPGSWPQPGAPSPPGGRGRLARLVDRVRPLVAFPVRPLAWAAALEAIVEPADIWHGMWAGSLPALARLTHKYRGRAIYDARDVILRSRGFERMNPLGRRLLRILEQRWAHAVDAVLTVNEAYAGLLERDLAIARPRVVMNCPPLTEPREGPPDRIRAALGLGPAVKVVLYQGGLLPERGIEETMAAILEVPAAVLVVLGYGPLRERLRAAVATPPYRDRVHLLDPVPPSELLDWTASADVMVMAIQPTTTNHRYTTPQKLFEALAVGVPVVASDLPGMAAIVRDTGCGVVCDPTSPASIAAAIRSILNLGPDDRATIRGHALAAARDRYNWEAQSAELLALYAELAPKRTAWASG